MFVFIKSMSMVVVLQTFAVDFSMILLMNAYLHYNY